jgi:transcription antitermination factor NusG
MTPSRWYVILTQPQQEIPCVWRIHLLGLEMFTPVIRRRVRTGRIHKGHAVTRLVARPMFPGYGFIRQTGIRSIDEITAMSGVRDFLRNHHRELVTLPHEAVLAVFDKQQEIHDGFLAAHMRRRYVSNFKRGDRVRVNDEGVYSCLVATVAIDARGRVQVLFGMLQHTLPPSMLVPGRPRGGAGRPR